MLEINRHLSRADLALHIDDLISLGEDPGTEKFWERVRVFIFSFGSMKDRADLMPVWAGWRKAYLIA